jgi:hypothetical protein
MRRRRGGEATGRRNIIPAKPLTRWTTARLLSTAPVTESKRLTPAVQKQCARADSKGGGPVPRGERISLKKPSKTREELESAIRLEMEDISDWPTDLAISIVPHEDSWKVVIMTDGPQDVDRCNMIQSIADRLRSQFDLKS